MANVSESVDKAIKQIVLASKSSAECLRKVKDYLAKNPTSDASETLAEAMDAYAERALKSGR